MGLFLSLNFEDKVSSSRGSSVTAAEAIERIGLLYDLEREIRGKPADLRREIRQARLARWSMNSIAG